MRPRPTDRHTHRAPREDQEGEGFDLRARALAALLASQPAHKVALTQALWAQHAHGRVAAAAPAVHGALPGRPERPALVHPARVPKRSPHTAQGLAALLHAIAHMEFNAINLARDAAWRFDGMPR